MLTHIINKQELLPLQGAYNFRDLGGITTLDGMSVKWGKLIRADDMHKLTNNDLAYLSNTKLSTIIDFRDDREVMEAPDKIPNSVTTTHHLPIELGDLLAFEELSNASEQEMVELMRKMNILFVSDEMCVVQYQKFFELIQNKEKAPLLYHCSAGKDRTGMATALILLSLGVDEQSIITNYLKSTIYLGNKYAPIISKYPNMRPMLEVRPEYLQAGIDFIKEQYGSVAVFLKNKMQVDTNRMKELYLSE